MLYLFFLRKGIVHGSPFLDKPDTPQSLLHTHLCYFPSLHPVPKYSSLPGDAQNCGCQAPITVQERCPPWTWKAWVY